MITLEELTEMARQIVHTADERGNTSRVEFVWLYTPGKPLRQLPLNKAVDDIAVFLMHKGYAVVVEDYGNGDETAVVHNHPYGNVLPSMEDLNALLADVNKNKRLTLSLIASTHRREVTGFYELEYVGEPAQVLQLIAANKEIYSRYVTEKYEFLDKNPHIREQMLVGDHILSREEYEIMVIEAMNASSIRGKPRPLSGYRFENWRFLPD